MSQIALLSSLANVRRRVRLLSLLHGIGLLVAASVGLLLTTVFLDYLFNLPPVLRLLVILASVGCVGFVASRALLRPILAKLRLTDVAGRVEETFPAFDDRLRSVVDFAAHPTPGSDAMKDRVVAQATDLAGQIDVNAVIRPRPAYRALGAGVAAVAICFMLAVAVGPDYLGAALSRLLTPFDARPWPKRTLIQLIGQVPARIPAGTPLDVRIKLIRGDRPSAKAIVYYQYGQGAVQQEIMTRNADGSYTASLDAATAGMMNVWTRSGDDFKPLPPVQVVPLLTIKQVEAVVTPPKYAHAPPVTLDLTAAAATVTAGSDVDLRISFNKPFKSVIVQAVAPDAGPIVQWETAAPDALTAAGHFLAKQTVHFRIVGTDEDDFQSSGLEEYQILVRPDQLPSVQFEKPVRNLQATPEATIPIQAAAEDDFGINQLDLVARRVADNKVWTIPLIGQARPVSDAVHWRATDTTGDRLGFRLNWDWELNGLAEANLQPGDQLEFYLRVQDNYQDEQGRPHNPPFSESARLRLTIQSQDEFTRQIQEELSQLRTLVDETRKQVEGLKQGTIGLQQELKNKPAMDRADRAQAAQLANDQSNAAGQTRQIADKLGEMLARMADNKSSNTEMANNVAEAQRLLNDAAENAMKEAAARLAATADQSTPKSQISNVKSLDEAQQRQATAGQQLQAAMDKMGAEAGLSRFLKQVADLLQAQRNLSSQTAQAGNKLLGKDPSQLSDQERNTLNDLAKQQQDLAKQADQTTKQMNSAADQQSRTDPQTSQALKQAADTSQQQNVSGQMNQAGQAEQQNQQADAQTAQHQAEIGLMMMMRQLKEAENRRLLELMKQLETAQELVGDLLAQQAGHNLDNLMTQSGKVLLDATKAGPDLIAELFDYSGRDVKHAPQPPPLETQIALQAQTERNTRNIVSVVQALPEGTDPAALLTRAAQQMSRAVTYLQDSRLTDAYQPPQVEAFAALLSAKENLDKQAEQAQQRFADQRKESLRQQYIEIRGEQAKLNDRAKAIDSGPRTGDGQFGHQAKANLGIISDQQADLGKRTAKLDDDLAAVGSVAYLYANDDIAARMGRVKDSLASFDAGKATQRTQGRIVAELDDMIKNLEIKPKQSQFSNPRENAGGAGGQGQQQRAPRLPPEAEIRLIQDMQRMLNDDTKDADSAQPLDKPTVLDLGKRQGDLRNLLDNILKKTSDGQTTLGPEPANKQTLPEEANDEDLDLQELKDSALNAKPDEQGIKDDTGMLGIRMARARQRLALDADPGVTTQKIQERIVIELDGLAKMAQQQQAQAQSGSRQRGQQRQNQPGQQQQQGPGNDVAQGQRENQGRNQGSPRNPIGGGNTSGLSDTDISATVDEMKDSWGKLSPRERAAVMEGSTDQTIQKFKDFVDGYYRTLATKSTEQPGN
jgi:Domain of unknown function (DUF4175)